MELANTPGVRKTVSKRTYVRCQTEPWGIQTLELISYLQYQVNNSVTAKPLPKILVSFLKAE